MTRVSTYCDKLCFLAFLIWYLQLASSQKSVFASANSTEAEALLKWKASFQNQTQNNLTSWMNANEAPCNTWIGVSCNSAGSVNRLNLTNSGIQSTLLEFPFMSLPNLAYVDLSYNELFDQIPPEISSLTKLIYFDVSYNQMSGKIPPEIGLLTSIQVLHLNANKFNGSIPQEIGQLKFVYELALNLNNLEGSIPASVGNLSQLTSLFLFGNQLSELAYTMKVTEKCDVYSFGVLALEVITGKKLGDLISSFSSPSACENKLLKDVLDQRLPPPTLEVEDELTTIARANNAHGFSVVIIPNCSFHWRTRHHT
ncbi:unnamed protein product [Malus baccata var. baccata]